MCIEDSQYLNGASLQYIDDNVGLLPVMVASRAIARILSCATDMLYTDNATESTINPLPAPFKYRMPDVTFGFDLPADSTISA